MQLTKRNIVHLKDIRSDVEALWLLPGKIWPPEMSVGGGLLEDWVLQFEVLDKKKNNKKRRRVRVRAER